MIEKYLEQYENTDERIYGFKVLRELFGISRQDAQKYMTDEIVRIAKEIYPDFRTKRMRTKEDKIQCCFVYGNHNYKL